MRLAPVAIYYCNCRSQAVEIAHQQSATTHAAPQCLSICADFCEMLIDAFEGHADLVSHHTRETVRSSGYVVDTFEAAVWAVSTTGTFEDALVRAVNLGDDADTVGAVTGQLAGALYGFDAIPDRWLSTLVWREEIEATADALIAQAVPKPS
jgi:ADP-ribosyl-[dinitrogen reductase] hydrolase